MVISLRHFLLILPFIASPCHAGDDPIEISDFLDPILRGSHFCPSGDESASRNGQSGKGKQGTETCEANKGKAVNALDVTLGRVSNYVTMQQLTNLDSSYVSVYSRHYFDIETGGSVHPFQVVGGLTHYFDQDNGGKLTNRAVLRLGKYSLFEDGDKFIPTRSEFRFTYDDLDDGDWRYEAAFDTRVQIKKINFGEISFSYYEESADTSEIRAYSYNQFQCNANWCRGKRSKSYGALGFGAGYGDDEFRWLPFSAVLGFEYSFDKYLSLFTTYTYSFQTDTSRFIEGSNNQIVIGIYAPLFY